MKIRELKSKERQAQLGFRYEVLTEQNGLPEKIYYRTLEDIEEKYGKKPKTYYCVQQRYTDGNADTIKIFTVVAFERPKNTYEELPAYDEYFDYFDSYTDAKELWDDFKQAKNKKITYKPR